MQEVCTLHITGACRRPDLWGKAVPSKFFEWNGVKVGLLGVVESEWKETTTCFGKDIQYVDQAQRGTELAKELRDKGADIVIAVTHSRLANDIDLAQRVEGVDLILGGHDHDYYLWQANGVPILNSGCNFKQLTLIQVYLGEGEGTANPSDTKNPLEMEQTAANKPWELRGPKATFLLQRHDVTSAIVPDAAMAKIVLEASDLVERMKTVVLGTSKSIWNAKASVVRCQESAIGNFVADLMRHNYSADIGLLQGGGIRSDELYGEGQITMGNIMEIFPFVDCTVVFEIQGKFFREALESGFSQYPKHEGRFPQLSGCWVEVDVSKPPGQRLVSVMVGEATNKKPLDDDKLYSVASKAYAMNGGDGYTAFLNKTRYNTLQMSH